MENEAGDITKQNGKKNSNNSVNADREYSYYFLSLRLIHIYQEYMTQHFSRLNESFVAAPKLLGELYTNRVMAEK